jgi:DNA-binding NarL/FixJ family response regulator
MQAIRYSPPDAPPITLMKLAPREKQIIGLIAKGLPNKQIAFKLCLTEGTIKARVRLLFLQLGVSNRVELALWARDHGDQLQAGDCVQVTPHPQVSDPGLAA